MTHHLKIWPAEFQAVIERRKTHEIREDVRNYKVGDGLRLKEWDPATKLYTGRSTLVGITYKTAGGTWGIPSGLCVLSIEKLL